MAIKEKNHFRIAFFLSKIFFFFLVKDSICQDSNFHEIMIQFKKQTYILNLK